MRIELHLGDITEIAADCIVNAAKPNLLGGGGVDGGGSSGSSSGGSSSGRRSCMKFK